MDTDTLVRNFRRALVDGYASWRAAADVALARDRGFLDEAFGDWAQAQWELLVERPLLDVGQFLDLYRAGSDYEMGLHSRVFFHRALPTHEVFVRSKSAEPLPDLLSSKLVDPSSLQFEGFMARADRWFEELPPFDHVLLHEQPSDTQYLVPLESVVFSQRPLLR